MSQFIVNGTERNWPVPAETTVGDLLDYIQTRYNTDKVLVSQVRINGMDLTRHDEGALRPIPAETLDSIEILTVHPRELAEETLQTLLPFAAHLAELSRKAGTGPESTLRRLIDGLGTFSEAVDSVKAILGIEGSALPVLSQLETETCEILRQIMRAKEAGDCASARGLLEGPLPASLARWSTEGIPAMIRSRDS